MANRNYPFVELLFLYLLSMSILVEGSKARIQLDHNDHPCSFSNRVTSSAEMKLDIKGCSRRSMIGSMAPICTHNECRGCKHKCTAELIPVEGNDPINTAYRYKCICRRL